MTEQGGCFVSRLTTLHTFCLFNPFDHEPVIERSNIHNLTSIVFSLYVVSSWPNKSEGGLGRLPNKIPVGLRPPLERQTCGRSNCKLHRCELEGFPQYLTDPAGTAQKGQRRACL
jgi:hypothetical protein